MTISENELRKMTYEELNYLAYNGNTENQLLAREEINLKLINDLYEPRFRLSDLDRQLIKQAKKDWL